MPEVLFKPTPHKEAAAFVRSKTVVGSAVFEGMVPELRARAFAIAGVEAFDVVQRVRDTIATLPEGALYDDVKGDIEAELGAWMDETAARKRATLLLRMHGGQAYAAAQYRVMDRQRDTFTHWQYLSMEDGRVRETHAALDGIVLPHDSPFWREHYPPWEWGCRCQVVPVSPEDVADIATADQARDPAERLVLDDISRAKLEEDNLLVRGLNQIYDMRSPRQKAGGDLSAYGWHPGDLGLDLQQIAGRYDKETWEQFSGWAKKQKVGAGNLTVWGWLKKKLPKTPVAGTTLAEAIDGAWPTLDRLHDVRGLGGSTGARLVRDPATGDHYVMKRGSSPEHIREEFLADELYRTLGVDVPEAHLYETTQGPVKLARYIEGRQLGDWLAAASPTDRDAVMARIREGFAADAFLGNWDVAGLGLDNILVDADHRVWRIDNGGSLRYRAQGTPKRGWGSDVAELTGLRDPGTNPAAAKLFTGIAPGELHAQIATLLDRRADILAALPIAQADLATILTARLDHLAGLVARTPAGTATGVALDAAFAAKVTESRILGASYLGDKDHIEDHNILFWQEKTASGSMALRARMRLTAAGSAAIEQRFGPILQVAKGAALGPQPLPVDTYWPAIWNAAKTVNHHAADGAYNAVTLQTFRDTVAALRAFKPADAPQREMHRLYLAHAKAIEDAIAAKAATPKLAQYLYKAPPPAAASAAAPLPLDVEISPWQYAAKRRDRGHAEELGTGGPIHTVTSAITLRNQEASMRYIPWSDTSVPYAHRGYVEITVGGETTPAKLSSALDLLSRAGIDATAAPAATVELLHLRKSLDFAAPGGAWEQILSSADPEPDKVASLKAWAKTHLAIDPDKAPGYNPTGRTNTWGHGWRTWDRWDLTRENIAKKLKGYGLTHATSTPLPQYIDSILQGGGQVTNTVERLRVGVPISQGMSPDADLGTGGANYFFTRIASKARAESHRGLVFKIDTLARADAYSFPGDRYGDVRPAGENTHMPDPRKQRGRTLDDYRGFAKASGNETIFKNGLHLMDDIREIRTSSPSERAAVLKVFADHGITTLPDGRKVEDIVL